MRTILLLLALLMALPGMAQKRKKKKAKKQAEEFVYQGIDTVKHVLYWNAESLPATGEDVYSKEVFYTYKSKRVGEYLKVKVADNQVLKEGNYGEDSVWKTYYDSGQLRSEKVNSGTCSSTTTQYYENGQIHFKDSTTAACKVIVLEAYDIDGETTLTNKTGVLYTYKDGQVIRERMYKEGVLDGVSKTYNTEGKLLKESVYAAGEFDEEASMSIVEMPVYPGGVNGLRKEVMMNYEVPDAYRTANIGDAKVVVKFQINEEGNVQNVHALTNYGYGLEEEAVLRVNSLKHEFTPGTEDGKPVEVSYVLPVRVVLR
ncbi:MAG: energy transducer TonB [Saprospiraceae bacterium]|nr:energy transducer TonB [Saprospiraceae bacterium]